MKTETSPWLCRISGWWNTGGADVYGEGAWAKAVCLAKFFDVPDEATEIRFHLSFRPGPDLHGFTLGSEKWDISFDDTPNRWVEMLDPMGIWFSELGLAHNDGYYLGVEWR